jgi:hypothetical protein
MKRTWIIVAVLVVIVGAFIWWLIEANTVDEHRKETRIGVTFDAEHDDIPVAMGAREQRFG